MPNFGDNYTYSVQFDANGIGDVQQATAALDQLGGAAKRSAKDVSTSATAMGRGGLFAAQNLSQLTYVIDDVQYGVRGLMNQIPMISTALLGFGTAGAAAGLAGTVLAGVFREQIDGALAYAGVLDENVVKGLNKGKESTEEYAESLSLLKGVLVDTTEAQRSFLDALRGESLQGDTLDAALVSLLGAAGPMGNAFQVARKSVADLEAEFAALVERAKAGQVMPEVVAQAAARLEDARKAVVVLEADLAKLVGGSVEQLKKQLEQGGDAAEAVLQRLEALPNKGPDAVKAIESIRDALRQVRVDNIAKGMADAAKLNDEMDAFADAILEGEEAIEDRMDAIREEYRVFGEALRGEVELVREAEAEKKRIRDAARMDRQQAEARANLDANAQRAIAAFGPMLSGQIGAGLRRGVMGGASPEQAGMAVFADLSRLLQRAGVEGGAADQAARQLVDEQMRQVQAMVDANNAAAQLQRMQLENSRLILNQFNIQRAMTIEGLREAERQRRQIEQHGRRFRPFGFMSGNPLGGRF